MKIKDPRSLSRPALLACLILGGLPALPGPLPEAPKETKEAKAPEPPRLVEPFLKGPVTLSAKVVRAHGTPEEAVLPLFQVPVLKFQDQLELAFAGEAFDERVTSADWSLVAVFLPRTVAPTDQGVVALRLKRKNGHMEVPVIDVPYDSIPMLFLIPDRNGRKKVLKDLNAHLEAFRTLCAKIADLSGERAAVDKFLENLDAIDKSLSPAQYDNAVLGFLHTYGTTVAGDYQTFSAGATSNLAKCQFLTGEVQRTSVLVPDTSATAPVSAQVGVTAQVGRSAYVSIFFDVATIIANLWPGHQFQYLPALARKFQGNTAELYYSDWIHTTGDTLGALMCCPGKWEDQTPPSFALELPAGEALLKKELLLKALPKDKDRLPFSLYGHDWKLLVAGPKGETLPPLTLTASTAKGSFVAAPGPLLEALRKLGAPKVQARVVGRWGFTSIATDPLDLPAGCDPAWSPTTEEKAAFQTGQACHIKLPATWASLVEKAVFRPAAAGASLLVAKLETRPDGSREAVFLPKDGAGRGSLELIPYGSDHPAVACPLVLQEAPPVATALVARQGETRLTLTGLHLQAVQAVTLGGRRFLPVPEGQEASDDHARAFKAEDGKPLEGPIGHKLPAALVLAGGQQAPLEPVALAMPRPHLAEVQVVPMALKGTGLALASTQPIAPTATPSQVSLLVAKGYRFPPDGAFHAVLRNAEEPGEARSIPSTRFHVFGNNQKAAFTLNPAELLGGRAAGHLELQVEDDHAGPSDWLPLPATFLDLPVILAVQPTPSGLRLVGPGLEPIEAVAPAPEGPWAKAAVVIEEGHETLNLPTPPSGATCYLKVFGWPDLVLTLPIPPPPAPLPKP